MRGASTPHTGTPGFGVDFAMPYGHSSFVEVRYHRISTDTPIELVPIAVGYRF